MNKDKVSLTIPAELAEEIRRRAGEEHRSFSGQVAYFLALAVGHKSTKSEGVQS
jgi:hypothetical protein